MFCSARVGLGQFYTLASFSSLEDFYSSFWSLTSRKCHHFILQPREASGFWPASPLPLTSASLATFSPSPVSPSLNLCCGVSLQSAEQNRLLDPANLPNLFLQPVLQLTVLFNATPHRSRGQLPVYLYHTGQHMTAALCAAAPEYRQIH